MRLLSLFLFQCLRWPYSSFLQIQSPAYVCESEKLTRCINRVLMRRRPNRRTRKHLRMNLPSDESITGTLGCEGGTSEWQRWRTRSLTRANMSHVQCGFRTSSAVERGGNPVSRRTLVEPWNPRVFLRIFSIYFRGGPHHDMSGASALWCTPWYTTRFYTYVRDGRW